MKPFAKKVLAMLGSRPFFIAVLVFFVVESLWVAFSAVYPMAFDEDFHFGLIGIYTHHWLPFLSSQPAGADAYGAVARDPSYLYHYLASFPDRLLGLFTANQAAHVIFLRVINIGLFTWALVLSRTILQRAGMSPAFRNTALSVFVLIPIVPLLAAQVSYDPLFFLLVAWSCLLVSQTVERLRARSLDMHTLATLASVCLAASLVKYAFLPVFAAIVLFIALATWYAFRGRGKDFWPAIGSGLAVIGLRAKVGLAIALGLSLGLFVQRYGVNMVLYHSPLSDCSQVLSVDRCKAYGPWARNYNMSQQKLPQATAGPLAYTWHWLQAVHYRLFFTINGPDGGYTNYPPLPLPAATVVAIGFMSIIAVALYWRRTFHRSPYVVFLLFVSVAYCLVLWLNNYVDYQQTGEPVAINGRYLIPILLPLAAVAGRALSMVFKPWPYAKTVIAGLVILLFLQGGGVLSFILRSDSGWHWSSNVVVKANAAARNVLDPFIISGNKYY